MFSTYTRKTTLGELRARLLNSSYKEACELYDRGGDPFKHIHTREMLKIWRRWSALRYLSTEWRDELSDGENEMMRHFELRYYVLLKEARTCAHTFQTRQKQKHSGRRRSRNPNEATTNTNKGNLYDKCDSTEVDHARRSQK